MKPILSIALVLLVLAGCKKEDQKTSSPDYLETVQKSLKDSLSVVDLVSLDFSKAKVSGIPKDKMYYLRIPFKDKAFETDFVAVRTSFDGQIVKGKIIHIEGEAILKEGSLGSFDFNGKLTLSSLNRKTVLNSKITKGYVDAFHLPEGLTRQMTPIVPSEGPGMMPEVVVVAYIHSSPGISWSTWASLMSFLGDTGGSGGDGWWGTGNYWPIGGGGGSSSGGSSSGGTPPGGGTIDPLPGGGQVPLEDIMTVDFETQDELEAIDLQKYINCFNSIPDAGSTCKIEILTDIPVDGNPNKIFNINSGSPGHTFLNIVKENGTQRASQHIGFYPKTGWKTVLTNAPIDGKFVDNESHEFNASFKMNITPAELTSVLTELLYLKNKKYDIDNYNCTDWALDVFNKVRTNKLEIPLYDIPGNVPSTGTRTPQGIYNKLLEMFNSPNHPEKTNITIDIIKGWAGGSTGPCN